jgi:type IV secretion system protein VirD4
MARPGYLSRRDGGRYFLQIRLGKRSAALYGRPILRANLKTSDFAEARKRLVDNLAWVQEIVAAPDLEALGQVLNSRLLAYSRLGPPANQRSLAERTAFELQTRTYMARANERGYAQNESLRGLLPAELPIWSRTVEVFAFNFHNADFHWLSISILLIAVGLLVGFATAAKSSWRILFPASRLQTEGPWRAAFMDATKIAFLRANRQGMPIGIIRDRILRYRPVLRIWPEGQHFVIAGTRAGKLVAAVKPAVLDHLGSLVALDLKGEIYLACHEERGRARRQIALDPYGVLATPSATFDPFSYIRGDDLHRDIGTFADGMIRPTTGDHPWVTNGSLDITKAAIESTMLEGTGNNRFLQLVDKLLSGDRIEIFEKWATQTGIADGRISDAAANLLHMSDRQAGAILDEVRQNLLWAKNPMMRRILSGNDLNLADVVAGNVDLYIIVPPDQLREGAGFLRLIMNLALGAFLRGGVDAGNENCLFIFDEFTRLGRMEKVIDIATIAAGYAVTAMFVAQNLDSVREVYGPSTMTLIGSCATTRVFGLGAGDTSTAAWLSESLGTATARTETRNANVVSSGETGVPLMQVGEILQLPADQQIVLFRGQAPARMKLIISHEHPFYRDRMPQRNA